MYWVNRTTNSTHNDANTYEIELKMNLDLRVFETMGYAHDEDAKRTKLVTKIPKCMFLGYRENMKG